VFDGPLQSYCVFMLLQSTEYDTTEISCNILIRDPLSITLSSKIGGIRTFIVSHRILVPNLAGRRAVYCLIRC
jgi:hypothetical protein